MMKINLKAYTFIALASLNACASLPRNLETPQQPSSLYIIVERNARLPSDFLTTLTQTSQQRLPNTQIKIDEGLVDDQVLTSSDWVIALRATRIQPHYTFQVSDNFTSNGLVDCLAGSGFGPGVLLTPCLYSTDYDFLEASVRDAHSTTLKTYTAQQEHTGWFWFLPLTAIAEIFDAEHPEQVWQAQLNSLYDKMLNEDVFNKYLSENHHQD
jgi:hypothetical protein